MRPTDAADLIRDQVEVPWDEVRAARVQRRVAEELRMPPRPAAARPWRGWWVAAASLLAVAILVAGLRWYPGSAETRMHFDDGSVAVLEPEARVVTAMVTPARIELRQTGGAVTYEVAPRPFRTFVVRIDDVRVEVLGTAFRVERLDDAIRVAVSRGRVEVVHGERTLVLNDGEDVTISRHAPLDSHDSTSPPPSETKAPEPAGPALVDEPPDAPSESDDPVDLSAAELFRRADDARASGDSVAAIRHLRTLIDRHPKDGRVTLATFTIGRLEAQRGNHAAAAAAFEACGAALSGEALAEAALARAAAGQGGQARALAARYLALFPDGPRVPAMSQLAE